MYDSRTQEVTTAAQFDEEDALAPESVFIYDDYFAPAGAPAGAPLAAGVPALAPAELSAGAPAAAGVPPQHPATPFAATFE